MKLSFRNNFSLGIDINDTHIRFIAAKKYLHRFSIEAIASLPLPSNVVVGREIKNQREVINALQQGFHSLAISPGKIAIALTNASVFTKILALETPLKGLALEAFVMRKVDELIPYPLEDIYVDYYALSSQKVFIAAARKAYVEQSIEVLEQAGFNVTLVEMQAFAWQKACQQCISSLQNDFKNKQTVILLFILCDSGVMASIYADGLPLLNGFSPFPKDIAVASINKQQGIMQKTIAAFGKQLLQQYQSMIADKPICQAFIVGHKKIFNLFEVNNFFQTHFGITFTPLEPLLHLIFNQEITQEEQLLFQTDFSEWLTALGLAARNF